MTDFTSAFRLGQEAAAKAQAARRSIADVVNRVSEQLNEVTNGRLVIQVRTFDEEVENADANALVAAFSLMRKYKKQKYLSASNPLSSDKGFTKLARWNQAEEGFPCTLAYGKSELTCYDVASLEAAFTECLASAVVGEKLTVVINNS